MEPCFCKNGAMSQCVATSYNEQQKCVRFNKSGVANRCMNRNELLNNHCWDTEAQIIGLRDESKEEIPIVDLSEFFDKPSEPQERRNCNSCLNYACGSLITLDKSKADVGGVNDQELWDIASNCVYYRD